MKEDKDKLDRELILRSLFEKWNPICLGCHEDCRRRDCPLCQEYSGAEQRNSCIGCPISFAVGYLNCIDTPYDSYSNARTVQEMYDAMEEEVEFLISLLDKETQENLEEIFILWCKEDTL